MTDPSPASIDDLETAMHQGNLGWLDRLLIKLAFAKAIARGHFGAGLADEAERAFGAVNRPAGTAQ